MYFSGLGTATPPRRFTQRACWEAFRDTPLYAGLSRRNQMLSERILCADNGIETRSLSIDDVAEAFEIAPDAMHRRFATHAPRLAAEAASDAFADAGIGAAAIDGIVVSTCTGYLCPGLTSYLIERLGLRHDVVAFDLVGQGCAAALPNWRAADALLAAGQCDAVLSICVEVCSAAFYIDDDPGVLISAALFGDGAAAAVLTRDPVPGKRAVALKAAHAFTDPAARDQLRFDHRRGLLRNILSLQVPRLAAQHAAEVLATGLAAAGLDRADIAQWIWHAGGRNVLAALQQRLELTPHDLRHSYAVLRRVGNVSSPFVYFVLQAALAGGPSGGWWWVSSFGAGFTCHGALLEVGAAA
jgi:alkylresorcinol/alkylpyrone synthase